METIGSGKGVAALFNAHARRFSPRIVRALAQALPDALIAVSDDFDQARRHVERIVAAKPYLVFAGGGDGSIVRLLNLMREVGCQRFPTLGTFRLGTGNAWARVTGAPRFAAAVRTLPELKLPLPTRHFNLIEFEDMLCPFAGAGWDARIINDYVRNLDKRSSQIVGSRLATMVHKGLPGYMYSLFRITIPEEFALSQREGMARARVENLGPDVYTLDSQARTIPLVRDDGSAPDRLYDGPANVVAAGTTPEWGFGFRAFPYAQAKMGMFNLRVYDRTVPQAVRSMRRLWRGEFPQPGMHDFYATRVRIRFSRPMPFQVGGDAVGVRDTVDLRVASETVDVLHWAVLR